MLSTVDLWRAGPFGRILFRAMVIDAARRGRPKLPRSAFLDTPFSWYTQPGHEYPTEYAALFLAVNGYMPSAVPVAKLKGRVTVIVPDDDDDGTVVTATGDDFEGLYCPKCGETKRLEAKYWYRNGAYWRTTMCKECYKIREKNRHKARGENDHVRA